MLKLSVLLLILSGHSAFAQIVSTGVGVVKGRTVTSREVKIHYCIEKFFEEKVAPAQIQDLALDSKAFATATQGALLDWVIALEAETFNIVQLSPEELAKTVKQAGGLKGSRVWTSLQVTNKELEEGLRRHIASKRFIEFRAQSSVLPVTDIEAQKYFTENRLKFGNLPFENFKENIKSFLSKNQVERRLKDWYEVLLSKYQVKNLIAEI